ncbi:MAG: hypothetical protein ACOC46_01170 [Pirellulales bacterium]
MRRHVLGIIGLLLLAGAVYFRLRPLADERWQVWILSAATRLGPVLVILWFAYEDLRRMPGWLLPVVLLTLVVLAIRPKLLLLTVPVLAALAVLRPRFGSSR